MPQMGVSVSEGTITKWLQAARASTIEADEPLLEISTDKVDTEVPSPGTGVVAGDPRPGGRDGRRRDEARGDRARGRRGAPPPRSRAARAGARRRRPQARRGGDGRGRRRRRRRVERPRAAPRRPRRRAAAGAAADVSGNGKTFVSPVVARIAAEHGVDAEPGPGHRPRRPRDEEGHPRVHRGRRRAAGSAPPAPPRRSPAAPPPRRPAAPAPQLPPRSGTRARSPRRAAGAGRGRRPASRSSR